MMKPCSECSNSISGFSRMCPHCGKSRRLERDLHWQEVVFYTGFPLILGYLILKFLIDSYSQY